MQIRSILLFFSYIPISIFSSCSATSSTYEDRAQNKNTSIDELQQVAITYQIEILTSNLDFPVRTTHGLIEGKAASEQQVHAYQPLFVKEFSLYPPELIA